MMLALDFASPWLLSGLLAAAIPVILHLLSNIRAQETPFPTLRFLQVSLEKTARRRRVQHWLLMALRMALLAVLALAVAQPVSRLAQGWQGSGEYDAVLILDNSYSMLAANGPASRFVKAQNEAASLLGGNHRPTMAALLASNGPSDSSQLSARLETLRDAATHAGISYGHAPLAQRFRQAIDLLAADASTPQKSIYLFSDLQRTSFDELLRTADLGAAGDIHLFVIDAGSGPVNNVGITDLRVDGQPVVGQTLAFEATLVNSSPVDKKVELALRIAGQEVGQRITKVLGPHGQAGATDTVRFLQPFAKAGPVDGDIVIVGDDDLAVDNVRRFALTIAPPVGALVVRGPLRADGADPLDAAWALLLALDPYGDAAKTWSIAPRTLQADQIKPGSLSGAAIAFFCDVPAFTPQAAKEIADFTAAGGTAVFFPGGQTQPDNYNKLLIDDLANAPLLPARLGPPTGEIGPAALALGANWMDTDHPFLRGLYENPADYLTVLVQRYYRLAKLKPASPTLMRLSTGEDLITFRRFGSGVCVLCATSSSPSWSNLPVAGIFLPMIQRMTLQAADQSNPAQQNYLCDANIAIVPGKTADNTAPALGQLPVAITVPTDPFNTAISQAANMVTLSVPWTDRQGYATTFANTAAPGIYRWQAGQSADVKPAATAGAFAVNPAGDESNLDSISPARLTDTLKKRGLQHVYVGNSLKEVWAQADQAAAGRNWWDVLIAIAIVLLVGEAVVANRNTGQFAADK